MITRATHTCTITVYTSGLHLGGARGGHSPPLVESRPPPPRDLGNHNVKKFHSAKVHADKITPI